MKSILLTLMLSIFARTLCSEKNNHLTFTITNKTNLNFYVHTCDAFEPSRNDGPLLSGKTYQYQCSFSRDELLQYKSLDFNDLQPWKKWFHIVADKHGQNFIVDILLARPELKQLLEIDLLHLKQKDDYVRHALQTEAFNVAIHLLLAKKFAEDYLRPAGQWGFTKMDLEGSTLEITDVHPLQ